MKRNAFLLLVTLTAAPLALMAQSTFSSSSFVAPDPVSGDGGQVAPSTTHASSGGHFSRIAFGAGVSPLGIQMQAATNINEHLNIRGTGNFFNYSTNFTTQGFTANAKLNLASAGAALDVYPFHAGFRISPGVLFYNTNQLTASSTVASGTSFTLNDQTFYSANANSTTGATPVNANAALTLNTTKPAFTVTTGWGNMIPRKGGHWSFPFEVGVAFIGAPALNVNLAGTACYDQAQTQCTNIASATNPIAIQIQGDLAAQLTKWNSDLNPLKTYPIVSAGVAYSFHLR
ncbi:MAG: hypothetical protein ABSD67_02595 [Terracidiphilus sp.]|jgi:hypothetical protein